MGINNVLKSGFTGLAAVMLLASCGIKQVGTIEPADTAGRYFNDGRDSAWVRKCSMVVGFTSKVSIENALEKYFFSTLNGVPQAPGEVSMIEPPVNWCFEIYSGGASAAFRIEYEDRHGGGFYQMNAVKSTNFSLAATRPILFHSSINTTANEIDFIFLDSQGFTQIVGPKVGDYYEAKLKFANLMSESAYADAYIAEVVRKCESGEWNVAKCMGYSNSSQFWWKQTNTTNQDLEIVREMLAGGHGAETGTIGTMRFRLSDVLR